MKMRTAGGACRLPRARTFRSRRRQQHRARPGSTASFSPRIRRSAAAGSAREVREAMEARVDHLAGEGLARRQGPAGGLRPGSPRHPATARTRRRRGEALGGNGLAYQPAAEGEHVAGVYRQRVTLASGRFAMIDDGLGLPARAVAASAWRRTSVMRSAASWCPGGGVDWSLGRKRGLGL